MTLRLRRAGHRDNSAGSGWPNSPAECRCGAIVGSPACVLEQIARVYAREIVGYARDALIIFVVVAAGMCVLSHPEKIDDAFLNRS